MPRPRALGLPAHFLACCWWAACALTSPPPDYQSPANSERHAVVKLRLTYHDFPGPELEQVVDIDGRALRDIPAPVRGGDGVALRSALVRPGTVGFAIHTTFFHNDVSSHAETYETTEAAPCGASTCMQIHPHTRLVNHVDRVDDATCAQGLKLQAKAGETYLVQYDFFAEQKCTLTCSRQVHKGKGAPVNAACESTGETAGKR